MNLPNIFNQKVNKNIVVELLKTTPEALEEFERNYKIAALNNQSDNLFDVNVKEAVQENNTLNDNIQKLDEKTIAKCNQLEKRIVKELTSLTPIYKYDGNKVTALDYDDVLTDTNPYISIKEVQELPEIIRPDLTGYAVRKDINANTGDSLLEMYYHYLNDKNSDRAKQFYHIFRQGLDILDVDSLTWLMIDTNPNSMSHWLPQLINANADKEFFKIPKTTIIKVPETVLQLTRLDYNSLTKTTRNIINKFCEQVFELDRNKDYFIKTGTYSSKFDFRNAHVHGAKEVKELGEYLLFIHFQALQMASPLIGGVCRYGVSTTTEWVVREFIKDKENNPTIYKGLPLHTEYRAFIDFDTKEILGITPYWDYDMMTQRFGHESDADSPHQIHDYVIFKMHNDTLMKRYNDNVTTVEKHLQELINDVDNLTGQWSLDIMQNDDDFWLIDMAMAVNSALVDHIDINKLKPVTENWLPRIDEINKK